MSGWNLERVKEQAARLASQGARAGAAAAAAAARGASTVSKALAAELLGAQCLAGYALDPAQAASAGPACVWQVFDARERKSAAAGGGGGGAAAAPAGAPPARPARVSAWVLDKRALLAGGAPPRAVERLAEQARREVSHLVKLRHPGVLKVIAPLEETRTQLVFLTEPVAASLEDVLRGGALPPGPARDAARGTQICALEAAYGLCQIADALQFLHAEAALVHRGVSPQAVVLTRGGAWKLAGFAFAAPMDFSDPSRAVFDFDAPSLGGGGAADAVAAALCPPSEYSAPELVRGGAGAGAGGAPVRSMPPADVYSLALLAYEVLAPGRPRLLPPRAGAAEHARAAAGLGRAPLPGGGGLPPGLEPVLRSMLAHEPGLRPPAAALAQAGVFAADVDLRALRFVHSLVGRDAGSKAAFLADLPVAVAGFSDRVLTTIVLPPLLAELRGPAPPPAALAVVLRAAARQAAADFEDLTLPALRPLAEAGAGEAHVALVAAADQLPPGAAPLLPALLARGVAAAPDARAQEAALRKAAAMAGSLDEAGLRAAVLPAARAAAAATTSAGVRAAAFGALAAAAPRGGAAEADAAIALVAQVTAVDRSPATAVAAAALCAALARAAGPEFAAARALPVLCPLLAAPALRGRQFAAVAAAVRALVDDVERARGEGGGGGAAAGASPAPSPPRPVAEDEWRPAASAAPLEGLLGGMQVGAAPRPAAPGVAADPFAWPAPAPAAAAAAPAGADLLLGLDSPARPAGGDLPGRGGAPMAAGRRPAAPAADPAAAAAALFAAPARGGGGGALDLLSGGGGTQPPAANGSLI